MWSLKFRFTALTLAFGASGSFAAAEKITVPPQHFSIQVKGKYGTQWMKLFQDGQKWACQTDDMPYFQIEGEPLKNLNWAELASEAKGRISGCRDQVLFADSRVSPPKKIISCLNLPRAKNWVSRLSHACGRY